MIFEYFPKSDMLYIQLNKGESYESEEVAPGIVVDYDADGRILGIEIEDASQHLDLSRLELKGLPLVDLIMQERLPQAA